MTSTVAPDDGEWSTTFNSKGQAEAVTDGEQRTTDYTYKTNGLPETVAAPGGGTTTYAYDSLGRLTSQTDPTGVVTSVAYTDAGRLASVTEGDVTTTFGYDNAGRRTTESDVRGTQTTAYTNDGLVDSVTTREGLTTDYDYDLVGRVKEISDPAGVVTTHTWSLRGELLTSKVSGRGTVTAAYNDDGTIASVKNQLDELTSFGYDDAGRVTTRTTPLGTDTWAYTNGEVSSFTPVAIPGQPSGTESYGRDAAGRINNVTDGAGRVHASTFDKVGALTAQIDTDGASVLNRSYLYNDAGRQWKATTPEGETTRTFDPAGRLTSQTDPTGARTVWGYDAFGRAASVVAPDGTDVRYSYDSAGRLSAVGGPPSTTINDAFTGSGAPPDPNKWTTTTSGTGHAATNIDHMALQSNWGGGSVKMRSKISPARDSEQFMSIGFLSTSSLFKATSTLTARTQDNGDGYRIDIRSHSWTAHVKKRVDGVDTTLGSFTVPLGSPMRFRFVVDGTSIKAKAWAHGYNEPSSWDYDGTDTSIRSAGSNEITYTSATANYAAVDDYNSQTNPSSETFMELGYDADNRLLSEDYPSGSRDYSYDPTNGQLTAIQQDLPGAARTTAFSYDNAGEIASSATGGVTTGYTYDDASQLTGVTPSSGPGTQSFAYQYGRVKTATVDGVTTTNTYDARSRLLNAAPSSGSATDYTYNDAGDRLTETTGAETLSYGYDPAARLLTTQRADSGNVTKTVTRGYSADGLINRYSVAGPGGTPAETYGIEWDTTRAVPQPLQFTDTGDPSATTTLANSLESPAATVSDNIATPIAVDGFGSPIATTGQPINYATAYDAWGKAKSPSTSDAQRLGYRNELTLDGQTYLRNRTYDTDSRQFTTTDPAGPVPGTPTVATPYHYTDNNPINAVDPLGLAPQDRNPMDDQWDYFAENSIGGIDDFLEGLIATAFGNAWDGIKGLTQLTGDALECAAGWTNQIPGVGRIVPDGWSCDDLQDTWDAVYEFGSEIWTSVSQLFTHHDTKALSYFAVSLGEVLTGVNMGDCLLTPYDDHDHYRSYAYCIGGFIGGGLLTFLTAGLTKAAIAKYKNTIIKTADEAAELATAPRAAALADEVVSSSRYTRTSFGGNRVYQRGDLIDPNFLDDVGRTNLQRMQSGLAPIGPDGRSVQLHHLTQRQSGAIAEVTATMHQQNSRILHVNPSNIPSGIDRGAFNVWRGDYWRWRAKDF